MLLDEPFAGVVTSLFPISNIIHLKDRGIGSMVADHNVEKRWTFASGRTSLRRPGDRGRQAD